MADSPKNLKGSAQIYTPRRGAQIDLPPIAYSNADLFDIYYKSPEVNYIGRTVSRAMSRVKFIPVLKDGKDLYDSSGKARVDEDLALAATQSIERIKSPIGAQSQVIGSIAGALAIPGDTWLLGYLGDRQTAKPDDSGEEMWITLSRKQVEVEKGSGKLKIKLDPNDRNWTVLTDNYKICRMWIPKFNSPSEADSWIEPLRFTVEKLDSMYQALAASALSQLNAGVIVAPSDQDAAPEVQIEDAGDSSKVKDKPLFTDQLVDALSEYVQDAAETSDALARVQPAVIGLDSEVRTLEWVQIARQIDPGLFEAIKALRQQIAISSPFPAEQLMGQNDAKFYQGVHNVQRLDQETFRNVYDPICDIIAEAFTRFVVHEDLSENFSEEEYSQIYVGWDNSRVVSPTDSCERAIALRQLGDITQSELRVRCGYPADVEGADEEIEIANNLDNIKNIKDDPSDIKASATPKETPLSDFSQAFLDKLGLIADQTITRMKERAGARLLSATNKAEHKLLNAKYRKVNVDEIGTLKGVEEFAFQVGETNETLFGGALSGLEKQYRKLASSTYDGLSALLLDTYGVASVLDAQLTQQQIDTAWDYFQQELFSQARKDFFNTKKTSTEEELPGQSVLYSIPSSILRGVSAILGGATVSQIAFASIATGPFAINAITSNGYKLDSYMWSYGSVATRKFPYELHIQEDGKISDANLTGFNGQAPGDHFRCQCHLEPMFSLLEPLALTS